MKNILFSVLFVLALLVVPTASYAAPLAHEDSEDPVPSITVTGYGYASAAPNAVRVHLFTGTHISYGISGPELLLVDPDDLILVRDLLVESGINEDTIKINLFSHSFAGPGGLTSAVAFTHDEPDNLSDFLQILQDDLKAKRGPVIHSMQVAFMVEDCYALEELAIQAAFKDAQERAARVAGLLNMTLGQGVLAISEDYLPSGCKEIENAFNSLVSSYAFMLANTASEVEVGTILRVTFPVEP